MNDLERAGLADIADAYRKLADLAVEAAADTVLGLGTIQHRENIVAALEVVDHKTAMLAAARRGYGRIAEARFRLAVAA